MSRSAFHDPLHQDPGLQPERTTLSWARTLLLLVTVAGFSLRWLQHHGVFVMTVFVAALTTSLLLYFGQQRRYQRASRGIAAERLHADVAGVLGLTVAAIVLGLLGLGIVIFLPV